MRLRRLLSTLRLRLRSVFRRARVEQELDDEIRDHIDRRVAADVRGVPLAERRRVARLRRHRAVEGSVPGRPRRERDRTHGSGPASLRRAALARADRHRDDDRDLRARHRLQHRAVPVRPVVRQRAGAGHPAAGVARPDPRHRSHPAGSRDRPRILVSSIGMRAQRTLFSASPRGPRPISSSTSAARGEPAERRRDLRHRQLFPGAGPSPGTRRGPPGDANDADPAPPLVAVISHVLWERHFERSPDVIGRAMKVNGVTVTIVGVAPRRSPARGPAGRRCASGCRSARVRRCSARPRRSPVTTTPALASRRACSPACAPDGTDRRGDRRPGGAQTTGSTGLVASTDVVPLLASNYFPPSGADEEASAGRVIA